MAMIRFDDILDSQDSPLYKLGASIQFKDGKHTTIVCSDIRILSADYGFCVPGNDDYKELTHRLISRGVVFYESTPYIFIPSSMIQFVSIFIEKT